MPGWLCLQGGREFTPACEEMDRRVVAAAGGGPVAVLAGAARVGRDYDMASDRARRHYEGLGARVIVVPDPRTGAEGASVTALQGAGMLVLPGGSPGGLRDVLSGEVLEAVIALHRRGVPISGASAGAMVLCAELKVPRTGDTRPGLALVPGRAVVHWDGREVRGATPDAPLWGLPECGGVLVGDDGVRAVGQGQPSVATGTGWTALPRDRWVPVPGRG